MLINLDESKNHTGFNKGDVINLLDLLFTKERDYLIRCNDGQQAEHLAGKTVIIYFDRIQRIDEYFMTSLMRVYNDLRPNNCLEDVFIDDDVDQEDPQKHFEDNCYPFIGYNNQETFKQQLVDSPQMITVDSMGKVVQHFPYSISNYGALGYPFTDERIHFLYSEDVAVARKPSLQTLLASPERDYLITNKHEKVVALYFYEEGVTSKHTTLEIKMVYDELTRNKENFEVVPIYVDDTEISRSLTNEETFWKTFKTMPWLALPFRDLNYKKLKRIFEYSDFDYTPDINHLKNLNPELVIVGPHFEFFEPFGLGIL